MIALNVYPVCRFIFSNINYKKQEVVGEALYTTSIVCSCGAVLSNDLLVISKPEAIPIKNIMEEEKHGQKKS